MATNIESFLLKASLGINNATQVEAIASELVNYGYTAEVLQQGETLLKHAQQANERQKKEYGEQYEATDKLEQMRLSASKMYMVDLKLARIALSENTAAFSALGLSGRRKQSLSGYLVQAEIFYNNLLIKDSWLEKLASLNRSKEMLQENKALIEEVRNAYEKQKKEMGEAQKATEERDLAIDQLADWYGRFIKVAQIALAQDPQLLEMLGVVEAAS